MSLPIVGLPKAIPPRPERPTQDNMPPTRADRDAFVTAIKSWVREVGLVPPMPLSELREAAEQLCQDRGLDNRYNEFAALMISNELWRESLATVPYERRLLLLPKCLRIEEHCPAPFDELGLLCKKCGLCSIQDLQEEAERMGYAVLVAEGSPIVMAIIETGQIEAIVGVSCLNVLERVYPYMEAAAIPGIAMPLLQDDCVDVNVDLDWVWDSVHLTSDDKTRRLDLAGLRSEVSSWFSPEPLAELLGEPETETERLGHEWLAKGGKRWRPFLAVAVYQALQEEPGAAVPEDLKRVAVAVECFHKASLVHDDIEDDDDQRYGESTLHSLHGVPVALNIGDYLLGEGYQMLAVCEAPPERRVEMLRLAAAGHRTLCLGQGDDLLWTRSPKALRAAEVVEIFRCKTAPAFEIALRLGATYAGAEWELHETLHEFSEHLGVAYQIRDDLEEWREALEEGGEIERRPTILWALAREAAGRKEKKEVTELWISPEEPDRQRVIDVMQRLEVDQAA
ncbi:MAG: polyprenyl synthetase family protein, partial [Acidobacteriota bacterium]